MMRIRKPTLALISVLVFAGCSAGEITTADDGTDRVAAELSAIPKYPHKRRCERSNVPGFLACHAHVRVMDDGSDAVPYTATPQGFGPGDLQSAYAINPSLGAGATIAIVDAYDDPNAESDLAQYRSTYGLPVCSTANGCFKKVNQSGTQGSYPQANSGWAGEIALDIEMASAACPNCKILLVEATSPTTPNLGAAVDTAVSLGATVVSNSYGGGESSGESSEDTSYYHHPGVAIFASSGDQGYGAEYPAASQYVIAVGGTSLVKSASGTRGWIESVWADAGSGCSAYETKPAWQKDSGCAKRTVADVSAVADPNTGVAVYDTYGGNGWAVYGGTSAASPLVAAIFALSGKGTADASVAYGNPAAFYDVSSGSNGSCGNSYLCTGKAGYDGPTGNGTPNAAVLAGASSGGSTTGTSGGSTTGTSGGSTTGGTTGSTTGGTTGGSSNTCTHALCSSGAHLKSGCDPCATSICQADPYCCRTAWDSICIGEVGSICGESCN
jgi:subtilase family serine protease